MLIWSQQYTSLHGQIYIDYYWLYSPIIIANPALLPSNLFFSHLQSSVPRLNQNLVGLRSVILLLTYKSVFVPVFDARRTEIVTSKSLTCQLNVYHPFFSPSLSHSASCSLKGKQVFTYIYIHTRSRIMLVMQRSHDVIGVSRSSPDDLPYPALRVLIPGWCSRETLSQYVQLCTPGNQC